MPQVRYPADIAVNTKGKQSLGKTGWFDITNIHITTATMAESGNVMICADGAPGGKGSRAILTLTTDEAIKVGEELIAQAKAAAAADEIVTTEYLTKEEMVRCSK